MGSFDLRRFFDHVGEREVIGEVRKIALLNGIDLKRFGHFHDASYFGYDQFERPFEVGSLELFAEICQCPSDDPVSVGVEVVILRKNEEAIGDTLIDYPGEKTVRVEYLFHRCGIECVLRELKFFEQLFD